MSSINPVREDAQKVMSSATDVRINNSQIKEFCDYLVNNFEFETASWDAPVFPSLNESSVEDVFDYFLLGNAINYCFNDLDSGEKYSYEFLDTDWSGAFGMWAALMDEYQDNPDLLDSQYLMNMTRGDVDDIFNTPHSVNIPLLKERKESINNVGEIISDLNGSFWNLFQSSKIELYGKDGVVEILSDYSSYEDIRTYNGQEIRFDKRSQLVVSMLYGKTLGSKYAFKINDIEEFTVFADYGIPAGLASNDIIEYSDILQRIVDNQVRIDENSPREVEIRASTVVSGEKIRECLSEHYDVNADIPVLDYVLWSMRQEATVNEHLTETMAY